MRGGGEDDDHDDHGLSEVGLGVRVQDFNMPLEPYSRLHFRYGK